MTSTMKLRELVRNKDIEALQSVLDSAPGYFQNVSGSSPENAADDIFLSLPDGFDSTRKFVLGIEKDAKLIGCIDYLRGYPKKETAMLGLFLLEEDAQGKGLGKQGYRLFESFLEQWPDINTVRIGVVRTNHEVLGFWKKMGFVETGEVCPFINRKVTSETLVLEKRIH